MLFWLWFRPRYKITEFFTIAPVLTSTLTVFRRNRGDPSSIGLRLRYKYYKQETLLSLTNRTTRLEVSQGHQTWYHSICYGWFPITVLLL